MPNYQVASCKFGSSGRTEFRAKLRCRDQKDIPMIELHAFGDTNGRAGLLQCMLHPDAAVVQETGVNQGRIAPRVSLA